MSNCIDCGLPLNGVSFYVEGGEVHWSCWKKRHRFKCSECGLGFIEKPENHSCGIEKIVPIVEDYNDSQ